MDEDCEFPNFQPQNKILNMEGEFLNVLTKTHKSIEFSKYTMEKWLKYFDAEIKGKTIEVPLYVPDRGDSTTRYTWTISDNIVNLTFECSEEDLVVDENGIKCPQISGLWWDQVSNLQHEFLGDICQVEFTVEYKWPYLIKGATNKEDLDMLSAYYLSYYCFTQKMFEEFEFFVQKSAVDGCSISVISYAMYLETTERRTEALHWLARGVQAFGNDDCGLLVALHLLEGDGYQQNVPLAEVILYRLVLNRIPAAFIHLGKLYMNGAPGVKQMPIRAKSLFEFAMALGEERAQGLLEQVGHMQPTKDGKSPEKESETTWLDYAISAGVIAGGVVATGFIVKWIFRRFGH